MSRPPWMDRPANPLSDQELDDLIRRAYQADQTVAPDRFDEIQARVVAAEARERTNWRRYFAGGHWFGYPPPPARPTFGDRAQAVVGTVVLFVLLLGLIVAVVVGVIGHG